MLFVNSCEVCACSISPLTRPTGCLLSFPIPTCPWSYLAIHFIRIRSFPNCIVSDCSFQFVSRFWKPLYYMLSINLCFVSNRPHFCLGLHLRITFRLSYHCQHSRARSFSNLSFTILQAKSTVLHFSQVWAKVSNSLTTTTATEKTATDRC